MPETVTLDQDEEALECRPSRLQQARTLAEIALIVLNCWLVLDMIDHDGLERATEQLRHRARRWWASTPWGIEQRVRHELGHVLWEAQEIVTSA